MSEYLHLNAVFQPDYSVYVPLEPQNYSGVHQINAFHQCGRTVMREVDGTAWPATHWRTGARVTSALKLAKEHCKV